MKTILLLLALVASSVALTAADSARRVEPYDWSHASPESARYRVTVDGQPVFVGDFWSEHFAQFAFTGKAEVEVTFLQGNIDPQETSVSPLSLNVPYTIEGNRLRFFIERAKQYVIRINTPRTAAVELNYLFLFAEDAATLPRRPAGPGVIDVTAAGVDATGNTDMTAAISRLIETAPAGAVLYFPPGTYAIEDLVIRRSDTTLQFAPGAFLQAKLPGTRAQRRRAVSIVGAERVTLRGPGLIQAHGYAFTVEKAPGLVLEDITIRSVAMGRDGANATPGGNEDGGRGLVLGHSDGYRLTNLKILTIMDQAEGKGKDGMNLASSSDAMVERCFTVSGDDTYTIKGRHDPAEWLAVDLGQPTQVRHVTIRWGQGYYRRFVVEASADAQTWSELATGQGTEHGVQTLSVAGSARYVRVRGQGAPANFHAGDLIRELEVRAEAADGANLALGRPVFASRYGATWPGGHEPERVVDGDPATGWAKDYRSRRVRFRDNIALVTANPIKIGTGADYAGEDISWENHDVVDAGFVNAAGHWGAGVMNFSHYNYAHVPHEMAMTRIRVSNARFEDTTGLVEVGWYFWRKNEAFDFATTLDAEFENVTYDRVHPGKSLFQVFAKPETAVIRMKFTNLRVAGRLIRSFEDLTAVGVKVDLRGLNDDDRIEFLVRP